MRFLGFYLIFLPLWVYGQNLQMLCKQFDSLYTQIRDQTIDTTISREQFNTLIKAIKKEVLPLSLQSTKEWIFPVQGYTPKYIGGKNGEGYIAKDYD